MNSLIQYVYRESPVHRRDPRVKIICVISLSIIAFQVNGIGLLLIAAAVMLCSQAAHLPAAVLLRSLRPVWPFFLFLGLLYVLFTPGYAVLHFPLGSLTITREGIQLGCLQIGRFLILVLAAALLTMTTSPSELTMGLEKLLRPLRIIRVPSYDIAMMISLALRFVPTLAEEMSCLREAQLARGADFRPRRAGELIRIISNLTAPLAISILRRCDELVDAMEARGYQQGARTYLRELTMDRFDYISIGLVVVLLASAWVWRPILLFPQ